MIEQEQFMCITMNGVVRGKSWTQQTVGRLVWYSAAGGSRTEVDEEGHS